MSKKRLDPRRPQGHFGKGRRVRLEQGQPGERYWLSLSLALTSDGALQFKGPFCPRGKALTI